MEISSAPRRFHLVRHLDVPGVSGTGVVAEGAVWSSGWVALHWPGHPRATSVWASLDDLKVAHGHQGATEVRFLDEGTEPRPDKAWPVLRPSGDADGRPRGWIEFDGSAQVPLSDNGPYDPRD